MPIKPLDYHLELGRQARAAARARRADRRPAATWCTTCAGSNWGRADAGFDWAQRFDEAAQGRDAGRSDGDAARLAGHRDFGNAVPTPDHFIPLLYLAGLAGAAGQPTEVLVDGYAYGSLSMTAYMLGLSCARGAGEGEQSTPGPVPPDASNI